MAHFSQKNSCSSSVRVKKTASLRGWFSQGEWIREPEGEACILRLVLGDLAEDLLKSEAGVRIFPAEWY